MELGRVARLVFVTSVIVIAAVYGVSFGADWSQWGGSNHRNMVSVEKGLPSYFNPQGEGEEGKSSMGSVIKWTERLGSYAYGNPTVSGGKVFVGTDARNLADDGRFKYSKGGLLKCLNEETGKLLWQLPVPERKKGLPEGVLFTHQHLGLCSSPVVDGDRLYLVMSSAEIACLDVGGQADGNDGPFVDEGRYIAGEGQDAVELRKADGDIVWLFDPIEEVGVCPHDAASCSGLIVGDVLYMGTSNGVDKTHEKMISPLAPSLLALDKRTGRVVATDDEKIGTRMYHTQWASPSSAKVGGRELVFFGGGDGICYAFEALKGIPKEQVHLKKVWWYDCIPPEYKYEDGREIPYYRGDKRKGNSPNTNDGKYVGPSQIIATPVFWEGRIYVAIGQDPAHGRGRGMLHCIDASKEGDITESGRVWTYDGLDRTVATASVADGIVYINDIAGRLHCLDADTGKVLWVYETNEETWGSCLIADGKIYFGNSRDFYIMEHGREAKLLSKGRLPSTVFSSSIAANGVIYVASNRELFAIAATGK